jgi:hypothetical protein
MSAPGFKIDRRRIEGLVILLVASGYLWEAHNVPALYQVPGVPGPTTFPLILGAVFASCGLWLLISPRKRKASLPPEVKPVTADGGGVFARIVSDWHFYTLWAVILAYLWTLPDLGFPLATFLLLAAFAYLLGETRAYVCLGLALGATVLIYVCFKTGLNVRLPLGVIAPLFK